jgi:hypothetical protein
MEFLTTMLVVITGIYAFFTYRILRANESVVGTIREQINSSVRPYVYFDLVPFSNLIIAKIKNTGITAAYNISVTISPQLRTSLQNRTFDARITSAVVTLMPPGKEIEEFIGSYTGIENQNPSLKYKGKVRYSDVNGRDYMEPFEIDLSIRKDLAYIGKPTIPGEIKKISGQLESISKILQELCRHKDEASD